MAARQGEGMEDSKGRTRSRIYIYTYRYIKILRKKTEEQDRGGEVQEGGKGGGRK